MKTTFLKIAFLSLSILAISSCSSNDESDPEIIIEPPVLNPGDLLTTQNVATYMVDANATKETVALFYNLKKLAKTKVAIGQQDAFNSFYQDNGGDSDIKKNTGSDPAILGSDFMFITDKNNNNQPDNWFYQQEEKITIATKAAYAKGIINNFCWHLREPIKEDSFYTVDMTADQKANAFKSILPGGANHEWYKKKLDKIASVLLNLKGSKGELIPIIFRPFHEFDGSWFWWGANFATAQEYKTAYQFTVDYLKNSKGVHNILYAFSPDNSYTTEANYLSRYPGDKYVDVLGMDNYGDFDNQGQSGANKANSKLKIIADLAKAKVKIAALTETGYQVTNAKMPITDWFSTYLYSALTSNDIEVSYAMLWNNTKDAYFVPNGAVSNAADFKTFTTKSKMTLVNSLPKMYELPK
ncbi:Mannan endo-1,4-beta-mannosidase [Flavobacterium bizetiae]|uniref:Mannan endo-1,4-beta-mannosidase n=1 Tax=Flavobacterium bizetiae TaxID=2704140 RepID=A0A6J4GMA4_9FLAO|nr:glycosyl hydrolase [Flavobacterium bizetiae]CAA9199229.1 Mannan endo-1,4-beta-mannosidase [Flavobacterium bizetiae]CAD5342249.1 Mannan endo-1,4-beta-mannosidase [Flavobacterium bizetiae]CAD5348770.1 Mannan endo-1,4-beta-mannosidase [Flavobacterium bizetiae]